MIRFNERSCLASLVGESRGLQHLSCLVLAVLLAALSYAIAIGADGSQVADLVARIAAEGSGTRFVLPAIQPANDGPSGTLKLSPATGPNEYEFDVVVIQGVARFDNFGTLTTKSGTIAYENFSELKFPNGPKSVFVFKGKVLIGTTTFVGNEDEPLQFVLLEKHGLVYLSGSGSVALSGGKTVVLPQPDKSK
jgi:hypothetical protein